MCGKIINIANSVSPNVRNNAPVNVTNTISTNVMRPVPISSNDKKVRYEIDFLHFAQGSISDHITINDHHYLLPLCKNYCHTWIVKMETLMTTKTFYSIIILRFGKTKVAKQKCHGAKKKKKKKKKKQ